MTAQDCFLNPQMPLEIAKIDWIRINNEEAVEYCLILVARACNDVDCLVDFLRRNGLILTHVNSIPDDSTISAYLRLSGFHEAGRFFGYRSWWALHLLNPMNLIAAAIITSSSTLNIRMKYNSPIGL